MSIADGEKAVLVTKTETFTPESKTRTRGLKSEIDHDGCCTLYLNTREKGGVNTRGFMDEPMVTPKSKPALLLVPDKGMCEPMRSLPKNHSHLLRMLLPMKHWKFPIGSGGTGGNLGGEGGGGGPGGGGGGEGGGSGDGGRGGGGWGGGG